jgi:hypothetical protein
MARGRAPPGRRLRCRPPRHRVGAVAAVLQPRGPALVVMPRARTEPVERGAGARGCWRRGQAVRQWPEARPRAARHRRWGPAMLALPCTTTEMGGERQSCWQVNMLHQDVV